MRNFLVELETFQVGAECFDDGQIGLSSLKVGSSPHSSKYRLFVTPD